VEIISDVETIRPRRCTPPQAQNQTEIAAERPPFAGDPAAGFRGLHHFAVLREVRNFTSFYWKIQALGIGPRVLKLGGRRFITRQAASDWLRAMEVESERAAAAAAAVVVKAARREAEETTA
jgi:hypothetical protein